jgi:hypothetical protein
MTLPDGTPEVSRTLGVSHISHLAKQRIARLADMEIPQMADVSGGLFCYT